MNRADRYFKLRPQLGSVMTRYAVLYFIVITLIASGIAVTLLDFTADRLWEAENVSLSHSMTLAAEDLENQLNALSDIRAEVSVGFSYRPSVLARGPYQSVLLLENFVRFKNYSPLTLQYFLLYQDSDKVYTSDGYTSYFTIYAQNALELDPQAAAALYDQLFSLRKDTVLLFGERILLLLPVRFIPGDTQSDRALVGFILTRSALNARIQFVAANLPDVVSLALNGVDIFPIREGGAAQQVIRMASHSGTVTLNAPMTASKWMLLHQAVSSWLWLVVAAFLMLTVAIALGLARLTQKPLRRLIARHVSPGAHFENEFVQLDQLIRSMENENNNSMRMMQNQLLLTILRGYYSESLIDRWRLFHIAFDHALCCILVLDAACLTEQQAWLCQGKINALSEDTVRIFAAYAPDDRLLAVLTSFDEPEELDRIIDKLQETLAAYTTTCFAGSLVEMPQRLSISYMEALTAFQRTRRLRADDFAGPHEFARQLVAAAERNDEGALRQLCARLLEGRGDAADILLRRFAIELTTEITHLAEEKHVVIDQQQMSAACLLPSMEVFLSDVLALVQAAFCRPEPETRSRVDETASSIVAYVQENAFDADFDLSRIPEQFGLSNDYLSAMIKRATGMAFKEYLTDLRINEARRLLRSCPAMSVNEVSEAVGYRKASNFIKKFKEKTGCTPLQYR